MSKKFYIKERNNPQFAKPYYIACGRLTKREAKACEHPVYGSNKMMPFDTESEYKEAIKKFKATLY